MSFNNPRWSVFCSRGSERTVAPSATGISLSRPETGVVDGVPYEVALSSDSVKDISAGGKSHSFDQVLGGQPAAGMISQSAIDGNNGGWAVLNAPGALSALSISVAID